VEQARWWLWLEGYDYVGVDSLQLGKDLQTGVQVMWSALQGAIPDLPPVEGDPPNDDQREVIRDVMDQVVSSPLLEAGRKTGVTEATAAARAILGDADQDADGDMISYARRALCATDHDGHLPHRDAVQLPQGTTVPTARQLLDALSLQRLAQRPIDVQRVRRLWPRLRDSIAMAGMQADVPPTVSPLIDLASTVHRRMYALNPGPIILGLAAVSTAFPEDEVTRRIRGPAALHPPRARRR
jgi:hypothetical protein